jgi:hypothetical protein
MPWPGTVIQRVYASVPSPVLQLGAANLLRPLAIGANWARIRVGMLFAINNPALTTITNVPIYMGLCSGMENPVGYGLTRSFLGACLTGTANGTCTLTYSASTNQYYTGAPPTACRKYEQTWVTSSTGTGGVFAVRAPDTNLPVASFARQRRTPVYVDITRGDSGAGLVTTISLYGPIAATAGVDYAPAQFLDGLLQQGTPVVSGQTLTVLLSNSALYATEMFGPLDTLCIYHSRSAFPLEIHAFAAAVKYPSLYTVTTDSYGVDALTQYDNGTLAGRSLNSGTGWSGSPWSLGVAGTNRGNPFVMASGDAGIYPLFGTNSTGTEWLNGTYWPYAGTQYPALYHGTTCGWPIDTFEAYATGSMVSGVTINSGSGWALPGVLG